MLSFLRSYLTRIMKNKLAEIEKKFFKEEEEIEDKRFREVREESLAQSKKLGALSFKKLFPIILSFILSLVFVCIAMTLLVNVSNYAIADQICSYAESEGLGYTYGRVVPKESAVNLNGFKGSSARLDSRDCLVFSQTFVHAKKGNGVIPLASNDAKFINQLTPDIVMPYSYATFANDSYGFELVSGNEISRQYTPQFYITQSLADEIIANDSSLTSGDYVSLMGYTFEGIFHYTENIDVTCTIVDIIKTESLGRFANINGGSFVYADYTAPNYHFANSVIEFFLYGNPVSTTNYLTFIHKGIDHYTDGSYSLELYNYQNGNFVLGELQNRYIATRIYYLSDDSFKLGITFTVLGVISIIAFAILLERLFKDDAVLVAFGYWPSVIIFAFTAITILIVYFAPAMVFEGAVIKLGNFFSLTVLFAIGLLESFMAVILANDAIKDARFLICRDTASPTAILQKEDE